METASTNHQIPSLLSLSDPSLNLDPDTSPPDSTFKVYVRCRPLNPKEQQSETPKKRANIVRKHENLVISQQPPENHLFFRCLCWIPTATWTATPDLSQKRTDLTVFPTFSTRLTATRACTRRFIRFLRRFSRG